MSGLPLQRVQPIVCKQCRHYRLKVLATDFAGCRRARCLDILVLALAGLSNAGCLTFWFHSHRRLLQGQGKVILGKGTVLNTTIYYIAHFDPSLSTVPPFL